MNHVLFRSFRLRLSAPKGLCLKSRPYVGTGFPACPYYEIGKDRLESLSPRRIVEAKPSQVAEPAPTRKREDSKEGNANAMPPPTEILVFGTPFASDEED